MLIDCFPFFNELDLLEIRLNSLAPYVDRFVLCEMPETHSGNPKPLYFEENKERFKDFPITHIVAEPLRQLKHKDPGKMAWEREHYQRECLMDGIKDADSGDIILLSDMDEIPNLDNYKGGEGAFKQKLYYYYLNVFTNTRMWKGTVAIEKGNIETLTHVRNLRNKYPTIVLDGGWHFSTLGSPEEIVHKIESFAHRELDTDQYKDGIAYHRENLLDPYGRAPENWRRYPRYQFTVEMPNGPKWLLRNQASFPHLFYRNGN